MELEDDIVNELKDKERQIEAAKKEVAEAKQEVAEANKTIATLQGDNDALAKRIAELERKLGR